MGPEFSLNLVYEGKISAPSRNEAWSPVPTLTELPYIGFEAPRIVVIKSYILWDKTSCFPLNPKYVSEKKVALVLRSETKTKQ